MDVICHPDPALKMHCEAVDPQVDKDLAKLVKRMAKAMYDASGIGFAASQIGVAKRVIVYDLDDGLIALCNPVIVERSDDTEVDDEGCLSLPGISVPVERNTAVVCEARKLGGEPVRIEASALHARLLQHEIDHLDGLLILDRATPEERKAAVRRYMELQTEH